MPASRSRTDRWRECLQQIHDREGGVEISVPTPRAPGVAPARAGDLLFRVRVLGLSDREIAVEPPAAAGAPVTLHPGVDVVVVMAIGQNRWMFATRVLGSATVNVRGRPTSVLRLAMPEHVERCQRRNFYRVGTAELNPPRVECWPVLNPLSIPPAEVANRAQILDLIEGRTPATPPDAEPALLPDVGPSFPARLMNIGGGGAGLMVEGKDAAGLDRARYFWLRVDLTPHIPAPIAMTARLAHTHIDSAQNVYAGVAFEWSINPAHRDFVVEQIRRYTLAVQGQPAGDQRRAA